MRLFEPPWTALEIEPSDGRGWISWPVRALFWRHDGAPLPVGIRPSSGFRVWLDEWASSCMRCVVK
ncbi:hypothetical protein I7I53_10816 [Histoplasma capsulatum var. duboisii H88]|uniref:Uncharacterized protein n=1 Tax=Ajellomyces capsulatus (strain H88) TaxID=544711 RepID=A0A8A1L7W9_AJEC8|nr:hypothetical protein I7I53_10816 [Histoplasma capsulatum var. duboisii H88]